MIRELYELEGLLKQAGKLRGPEKLGHLTALWNDLHDTEARVAQDPNFMDHHTVRALHGLIHTVTGAVEAAKRAKERAKARAEAK